MNPGADKPLFNAYVDGFNLYMGALHRRPHLRWLDLPSLCAALRPNMRLNKVYYFTSRLKERFEGDDAPRDQHAYLRVLESQGVQVIYGKFRKDRKWLRVATTQRKSLIEPTLPKLLGITQATISHVARKILPDVPKVQVVHTQ